MGVKIRNKGLSRSIYVYPLLSWTGLQYHTLLVSYAEKSNDIAKYVDHINIIVQGRNVSSMDTFGFHTYCYLEWKNKNCVISVLRSRVEFSLSYSYPKLVISRKMEVEKKKRKKGFSQEKISISFRNPISQALYLPNEIVATWSGKFFTLGRRV